MSEIINEAHRVTTICNACRYCEGFCAVFPAMELRRTFTDEELKYFSNLCHNCRGCYYCCQYAPPHEFQLNYPKAMAELRKETYSEFAWPGFMGKIFKNNGMAVFGITLAAIIVLLAAAIGANGVQAFFTAYTGGQGLKAIARTLNEQRRKTPAQIQLELLRKRLPSTQDTILKKYLWDGTMVSRILRDESYIGTLICHKSERNKINKTFRFTDPEEQFRHENYLPMIVTRETWELAQTLLTERKAKNTRAGTNKGILRYGGLLRCQDCGRTFIGKRIKLKDGERVVYVCDTYHRYGKEHCSSHMVDEEALDRLISAELLRTKELYEENWSRLEWFIEKWTPKASMASAKISKLQEHILLLEEEVEVILMERIRDKANAERYDRMIAKREEQIAEAKKQIEELQNISEMLRSRQAKLKRDISLIDDILQGGKMSEAHLKMLVEKILVHEEDGKLDLEIRLKAPFRDHLDIFENGERTDSILSAEFDYDRLGAIIYGDYYAG